MTLEQQRLDALAAYAVTLRAQAEDDERLGEIADQIELLAWGPIVIAAETQDKEQGT